MSKQEEVVVERLGSEIGKTILKATVTENGMSMDVRGTNWELLNIVSTLIDHEAVENQVAHEDILDAVIEILLQDDT